MQLAVRDEVREALAADRPVVALESTLFAHGLPRPDNLGVARELEGIVVDEGAVPATVGVVDGNATVGLSSAELERLATGEDVAKLAARDLPVAVAQGRDGATTVSATTALAARVGVRVFATGGLGGVHRDAKDTWDESADLVALARTPITVVCAGVKSALDVPATLERLETLGVPVVGYRTATLPGFLVSDTGLPLSWSVASPGEVAAIMAAGTALGLDRQALVVANPVGEDDQLEPAWHDRVLTEGLERARVAGVRGPAVTPFLMTHLHEATAGASLAVNAALARRNTRLAARIAVAAAAGRSGGPALR